MSDSVRSGIAIALLSVWLGAALLLAAVVAPAAFAVLPSRSMAGDVVGRVLGVVFYGGMVIGLATSMLGPSTRARRLLGAALMFACAIAQFQTGPQIARLRTAVAGPIDALAPSDPQRILFGRLHAVSVGWLAIAMLAAFALLILTLVARRPRMEELSHG